MLKQLREAIEAAIEFELINVNADLEYVEKLLKKLDRLEIPCYKLHCAMMILRDIRRNRIRLAEAIRHMTSIFENGGATEVYL